MMTNKEKQAKVRLVMQEFKSGKLKSSSGEKITDPRQALAVALAEAGLSRKPKKDMSDEYYMAFMKEIGGTEEEENDDTMDESTGEKRCKAYLATVQRNKRKKT
jgi:hypothetical protein